MPISHDRAFTLIEILVAVMIISILALIAVPNMLESQTRAKASRVKSELSTIAKAIETYRTDNNKYPEDYAAAVPEDYGLGRLTSPVAYISSVPSDPFGGYHDPLRGTRVRSYSLGTSPDDAPTRWALASAGPDQQDDTIPLFDYPGYRDDIWENPSSGYAYFRYDSTNGTVSRGDIIRTQERPEP